MFPEFDPEDLMTPPVRVVRAAQVKSAEGSPTQAMITLLRQIPPLLHALLTRETPPAPAPMVQVSPAQVTVQMPPAGARTVECHFERHSDGRIKSPLRFTITDG